MSRAKTPSRKVKGTIVTENEIGKIVLDAAVKVHKALGPDDSLRKWDENLPVYG